MAHGSPLLHTLSEFAHALVRRYDVPDMLYELAGRVTQVLGVDGCAVSLGDDEGALRFVAASGERVALAEQLQEQLQAGPARQAYRSGRHVLVADLSRGRDGWEPFAEQVLAVGLRAVASFPMSLDGASIGALNAYSRPPRGWDHDDLAAAQVLADMATSYVLHAVELRRAAAVRDQLQQALDSRIVIEQAKGILAERHGTDVDAAFGVLRRRARDSGTKLHDVCRAVIDGSLEL